MNKLVRREIGEADVGEAQTFEPRKKGGGKWLANVIQTQMPEARSATREYFLRIIIVLSRLEVAFDGNL